MRLLDKVRDYPGLVDVDTDLKLNSPQLDIAVDREKAAAIGVEIDTLGRTLETMLGGRQVTRFKREGEQYDVVVKIADIDRQNPDDLRRIYVRGRDDAMVPLSNLITHQGDGGAEGAQPLQPAARRHHHRAAGAGLHVERRARLPGQGRARRCCRPPPISTMRASRASSRKRAPSMYLTFLLALAFIYLVLAAQFESFTDPFIIMLTVPLSITGALLALWWSGGTLNIYSQVGLVTLIGLITKHGILIVEFSNQLRAKGMPMREAVIEAAALGCGRS